MNIKHIVKTMFFSEIITGLVTTFKHMFVKEITEQYPHQKKVPPSAFRGVLSLLLYSDGSERCVGCCLCEAYCPSNCIRVVPMEDPNVPGKRFAKEYYINIARCVFCGYCVEACPVNALAMTPDYEHSVRDRRELYFDKAMLLSQGIKFKDNTQQYLSAHNMGELTEQVGQYPFPVNGGNKIKKDLRDAVSPIIGLETGTKETSDGKEKEKGKNSSPHPHGHHHHEHAGHHRH